MNRITLAWLPLGAEVLCFGAMAFLGLPGELVLEPPGPGALDAAVLAVDRGIGPFWLLFLAVTLLGTITLIQAVCLGLAGERPLLRRLGFRGRLALSLCQGGFLVIMGLSVLAGALAFSALLGPLGLLGAGLLGALGLGWLWFAGLGPSACLIAWLWTGARAGAVPWGRAAFLTLLLLIPAADLAAAVIVYRTSPGNGTRTEGIGFLK